MDYDLIIERIVKTIQLPISDLDERDSLLQCLTEIITANWHLASEIANAEATESEAIIAAKEEGFKVSYAEAETRGKMNTSGRKTKLKHQFSVLEHLFVVVQEKLHLISCSSQPEQIRSIHHPEVQLSSSLTSEAPSA